MIKIISQKDFTALKTENAGLLVKLQEAETTVTNLQNMSKDMTEKQAEHNNVITQLKADHDKALANMKATYETQISDLNKNVTTEATSSETKAITILAQIGVPMDDLPQATTEDNSASILNNMKGMTPSQLSDYFNKNKKAVFDALKKKTTKKDK